MGCTLPHVHEKVTIWCKTGGRTCRSGGSACSIEPHTQTNEEGRWKIFRSRSTSSCAGSRKSGSTGGRCVKRGLAAGVGLTVLSLSPAALAARKQVLATPPTRGTLANLREIVQEAKKEGHLNTIALPPRLGELRRDHDDVREEVRHRDHERQPRRQLGAGEPGDRLAQGRPASARRRRRQPDVRGRRHGPGPVREVLPQELPDDPAGDEGHARPLDGRLLGLGHDRLQRGTSSRTRRRRSRTCSSPSTRTRSP